MGKAWDSFAPEKPILRSGWESAGTDAKISTEAEYAVSQGKSRIAFGRRRSTFKCSKCGKRDAFRNPHPCGEAWEQEWVDKAPLESIAFENWSYSWAIEAYRVMKPGAHLVAFGGTRMFHRLACALEDAGFEIRDSIGHLQLLGWVYGAGFPKSLDVSKAIDAAAGAEREPDQYTGANFKNEVYGKGMGGGVTLGRGRPATEEAAKWQGYGTAIKPAWEPIILARKPLVGTVAQNIARYGTGALNIDGSRISAGDELIEQSGEMQTMGRGAIHEGYDRPGRTMFRTDKPKERSGPAQELGRWPANVVLSHTEACELLGVETLDSDGHHPGSRGAGGISTGGHGGQEGLTERSTSGELVERWQCVPECPVRQLDEQSGEAGGGFGTRGGGGSVYQPNPTFRGDMRPVGFGDSGGASRFFYCAKADRSERDAGLEGFEKKPMNWSSGEQSPGTFQSENTERAARNNHPTVKPLELMRWLVRLITPPGGRVLDPFVGSGTTLVACKTLGIDADGIDREAHYAELARARVARTAYTAQRGLVSKGAPNQGDLFAQSAADNSQTAIDPVPNPA